MYGDEVTLTATATLPGWKFDSWSGSGAVYVAAADSASTTLTMPDADIELTANFVRNPRSLTLAVNDSSVGGADAGSGSISGKPGGSALGTFSYVYGDEVTLTATATLPGWKFDSWSGSGAVYVAAADSASTTLTMPDADIELTANFVRNPRSLTLAVNDSSVGGADAGSGSISGKPGGSALGTFSYVYGDEVTLTATATLPGWKFDSWSGSGAVYVAAADSASTTLTMPDADIELTANFCATRAV